MNHNSVALIAIKSRRRFSRFKLFSVHSSSEVFRETRFSTHGGRKDAKLVRTGFLAAVRKCPAGVLLLLLAGCLYIPPFGSMSPERLAEIKVGSTAREQVLKLLGEPKLLKHDNFFIYDLYSSKGTIIGLIPAGYTFVIPLAESDYRLLLAFDEIGVVKRYQIERGHPSAAFGGPTGGGFGGGISPHKQAEAKPQDWAVLDVVGGSAAKRVFKKVVPGLFASGQKAFGSVAFSPDGRLLATGESNDVWPVKRR